MDNCMDCDEHCMFDERSIRDLVCIKFERLRKYKKIEFLSPDNTATMISDIESSLQSDKDKYDEACKQRFDSEVSFMTNILVDCSTRCGYQLEDIKNYISTIKGIDIKETEKNLIIVDIKTQKQYRYDKFLEDGCALEHVQAFVRKVTK